MTAVYGVITCAERSAGRGRSPYDPCVPAATPPTPDSAPIDEEARTKVARVIELMRPAIQADGGDVELIRTSDDGVVYIRFHGACVGCPSSDITLNFGIERNLRDHVPGIREVRVVD